MYVALMQGSCDDEDHVVDHVAIGAVVQELRQRLIRLQQHTRCSDLLVQFLVSDSLSMTLPKRDMIAKSREVRQAADNVMTES